MIEAFFLGTMVLSMVSALAGKRTSKKQSARDTKTEAKAAEYTKYMAEQAGNVYATNDLAKIYGNYELYLNKLAVANADGKITKQEDKDLSKFAEEVDEQAYDIKVAHNGITSSKEFSDEINKSQDDANIKGGVVNG